MPMPSAYETRSEAFFRLYEGETPQEIQTLLTRWIPKGSRVLELGCGSGRDARFMSGLGAIVEATDGSGPLLKLAEARAQALLGAESPSFSLLCLPPDKGSEDALFARLPRFDAVYTCGVLQHLSDHELYEAACFMERAVTDKGTLIVVVPLDHKGDPDRKTFLRDSLDYATLFERMGFRLASQEIRDGVGSPGHECRWASCVFLRDSQSELSNRRFRHILEKDAKTSTYKLALLRALCDINRTMPRSVRFDNGKALVPLGLIAERWIRDYWQLASGPRMPRQIHQNRELGFGTALERTMTKCHSQYGVFESLMRNEARSKDQTSLLQQLFDDVVTTALKGPIHYIQDDGRNPVFTYVATHAGRRPPFTGRGSIIERYGLLAFPAELWLELNRIAPWLEDSLILEWARLSARFESCAALSTPLRRPTSSCAFCRRSPPATRTLPQAPTRLQSAEAPFGASGAERRSRRRRWPSTTCCPGPAFTATTSGTSCPPTAWKTEESRTPFRPPTFCMTRATEYSRTGPCSPRSLPPASPVKLK